MWTIIARVYILTLKLYISYKYIHILYNIYERRNFPELLYKLRAAVISYTATLSIFPSETTRLRVGR